MFAVYLVPCFEKENKTQNIHKHQFQKLPKETTYPFIKFQANHDFCRDEILKNCSGYRSAA
jgi:hypothetical protein